MKAINCLKPDEPLTAHRQPLDGHKDASAVGFVCLCGSHFSSQHHKKPHSYSMKIMVKWKKNNKPFGTKIICFSYFLLSFSLTSHLHAFTEYLQHLFICGKYNLLDFQYKTDKSLFALHSFVMQTVFCWFLNVCAFEHD